MVSVALSASSSSIQLARQRTEEAARRMFHVSLPYLFSLCLAMLVDLLVASLLGV